MSVSGGIDGNINSAAFLSIMKTVEQTNAVPIELLNAFMVKCWDMSSQSVQMTGAPPGSAIRHEWARKIMKQPIGEELPVPRYQPLEAVAPDPWHSMKTDFQIDSWQAGAAWLKMMCHDDCDKELVEEVTEWLKEPEEHMKEFHVYYHPIGSLQTLYMNLELKGVSTKPDTKTSEAFQKLSKHIADLRQKEFDVLKSMQSWTTVGLPQLDPFILGRMEDHEELEMTSVMYDLKRKNKSEKVPEAMTPVLERRGAVILNAVAHGPVKVTAPHSRSSGPQFTCGQDLTTTEKKTFEKLRKPYDMSTIPQNHPYGTALASAEDMVNLTLGTMKKWQHRIPSDHDWKEKMARYLKKRRDMRKDGSGPMAEWAILLPLSEEGEIPGMTEPELAMNCYQVVAHGYGCPHEDMTSPNIYRYMHDYFCRDVTKARAYLANICDRRPGKSRQEGPYIAESVGGIRYAAGRMAKKIPDIQRKNQKRNDCPRAYCLARKCSQNYNETQTSTCPEGIQYMHCMNLELDPDGVDENGFFKDAAVRELDTERIVCTMDDLMQLTSSVENWHAKNRDPEGELVKRYGHLGGEAMTKAMIADGEARMICYNCGTKPKNGQLQNLRLAKRRMTDRIEEMETEIVERQDMISRFRHQNENLRRELVEAKQERVTTPPPNAASSICDL